MAKPHGVAFLGFPADAASHMSVEVYEKAGELLVSGGKGLMCAHFYLWKWKGSLFLAL